MDIQSENMKKSDRNLLYITSSLEKRETDFRTLSMNNLILDRLACGSVLDIGCGSGHFMHVMKEAGHDVHGVESNKSIIQKGNRIFGALDIKHGRAEDIGRLFRPGFSNITIIDVLEHIEDDNLVLRESYRLLKKGGRILVFVPAYPQLFCKRDVRYGHYRRYSKPDLRKKMEAAGFHVSELRYWNSLLLPPYILYSKLSVEMENKYIGMRSGSGVANRFLTWWFSHIENSINFGFGVNLICVGLKM